MTVHVHVHVYTCIEHVGVHLLHINSRDGKIDLMVTITSMNILQHSKE